MKELNYKDALLMCKKITDKLVKEKKLKKYCEENNLDYQSVLKFIRVKGKKRYPKLLKSVLESNGYKVIVNRKINYTFFLDK